MIPVQENTSLAFVVEKRAKVNPTNNMPAPFELLFKALLDVLSRIFEVRDFTSDHLHVNVLSDKHGVLLVLHFHVAEFNLRGDGDVWGSPVFRNTGSGDLLLLLLFWLLVLLLGGCCHSLVGLFS
jgi:hypothetical protein